MRRALLLCIAVTLLGLLGLGGCVTPSIPIPPPSAELMTFDVSVPLGTARFTYPATDNYVGTLVFVYNSEQGVGIIEHAHDDGSVGPTQPVAAALGDQIVVSFQGADQTVSTCIKLRNGTQDPTDYCQ